MAIRTLSLYINNALTTSVGDGASYQVTSTGLTIIEGVSHISYIYVYPGTDTFLGFSLTSGTTTPDINLGVNDSGTFTTDMVRGSGGTIYLYTVSEPAVSELLTVKYNNTTAYATSEDGTFKLTTKGKFLEHNIDVDATIEAPLIDDTNATTGDILSSYTAYVNDNKKITGIIPTFAGSVTVQVNLITFTIKDYPNNDIITYQAEDGMTWAEWVNSNYNTNGYTLSLSSNNIYHITKSKTINKTIYNNTIYYNGSAITSTEIIVTNKEYYEITTQILSPL